MTRLDDFLKLPISFSQDLSAAALSYTTTMTRKFRVKSISFKASQNITEDITITRDSHLGATYDIKLRTKGLVAEQNYIYVPERGDDSFNMGDNIKIECTNANGVGILYGELKLAEA